MLRRKNGIKWYVQNGVIYPPIHMFIMRRDQQGENTASYYNWFSLVWLKVVLFSSCSFYICWTWHNGHYYFIIIRNIIKNKIELPVIWKDRLWAFCHILRVAIGMFGLCSGELSLLVKVIGPLYKVTEWMSLIPPDPMEMCYLFIIFTLFSPSTVRWVCVTYLKFSREDACSTSEVFVLWYKGVNLLLHLMTNGTYNSKEEESSNTFT